MIGVTITPSHIDYSKILSDKTEHDLVMGDCIIILAAAKENTIRDTGELVNSEMWAMSDGEGGFNDGSGRDPAPTDARLRKPNQKNVGYVGSNSDHAGPVEYGIKDKPNYPRQPYLRPALDGTKKEREARHGGIIKTSIDNAYTKAGIK